MLQSLTYAHTANDAISKITNAANAALTQTYGYDELSRLTAVTATNANQAVAYDPVGNRSSHTWAGLTDSYTSATGSNRLLAISGARPKTFTLNANGNLTAVTGTSYTYDAFERLATATKAGVTTTYSVNGLGQRIYKKVGTVQTWFGYAPDNTLLSENKTSQGWTHYVYLGGAPIALIRSNQIYYLHTDHLGRAELATNSAKTAVWKASNYAFDRTVTLDSIGGLNLGFPGQYYDAETGNWHNGFRDYDATIGRYIQSDPIGLAGGLNTYAYVSGNPVNKVDPLGLRELCECEKQALSKYEGYVDLNKVRVLPDLGLLPNGTDAMTLGYNIFHNSGVDVPGSTGTIALIGHELEHVFQQQMWGGNFLGSYMGQYMQGRAGGLSDYDAYRNIGFETQGHNAGDAIKQDLLTNGNPCD